MCPKGVREEEKHDAPHPLVGPYRPVGYGLIPCARNQLGLMLNQLKPGDSVIIGRSDTAC